MTRHPSLQVCCVTEKVKRGDKAIVKMPNRQGEYEPKRKRKETNKNVARINEDRIEGYEDVPFVRSCQLARGNC